MKQYKYALIKRYFDIGYGISNYVKYIIALFGLSTLNLKTTMILAAIYFVFCFVLGWFWVKSGMYTAEIEVANRNNLFVKEMRKKVIRSTD